jgi:hypothetical protein
VECFQGDAKTLTRTVARTINEAMDKMPGWVKDTYPKRYGPYGNQRGHYLVETDESEYEF